MSRMSNLKTQYTNWLLESTDFKQIDNNTIRIDTPFLDNDFDSIVLYVDLQPNNKILISDDGYTLSNLQSLGYSINNRTKKRTNILTDICTNYGIDWDSKSKELYLKTDFDKFAVAKHRLLQAVLKINDMFLLRPNYEPNLTFEGVSQVLDENDVLYTTRSPVIGKGGITFIFDFQIPTRQKKEKLVRIITSPNDLNYSKVLGMDASMINGTKDADYIAILDDVTHDLKNFSEIESIYNEVREKSNVIISPIVYSELKNNVALLKN